MSKSHPRWRMAKRVLTVLFFIAVIILLVIYAQKVDWQDVWKVIRGYDRLALFSAIALVIVSYLIYGCYDLLGRAYCGHKLAKRQVMLVSFICYAFNLTLSTWVGGIGMRYRLYSRLGLSAANWMAMGAIIWLLLGSEINYFLVLGVLLVSSIAGVIIHIPAGIGVLEAVFIAMLSGEDISKGAIIAALLAWRALYYFLPLLLATVAYLLLESRAKKLRQKNQRKLARE